MPKTLVITVAEDVPDTELGKPATVTIEGRNYTGAVTAVILHPLVSIPTSEVTLRGAGLETVG